MLILIDFLITKYYNLYMDELKNIIANNIQLLRKSKNLTQFDLGEAVHYSDKAVSRWEKGETIPDILTLQSIAQYFGVEINYLFEKHEQKDISIIDKNQKVNKIIVTVLSCFTVTMVALVLFLYLKIFNDANFWQAFIWMIPVMAIVLLYCNKFWGDKKFNIYIKSIMLWGIIVGLYCQFITLNLWLIFILGVLIQTVTVLSYFIQPIKHNKK